MSLSQQEKQRRDDHASKQREMALKYLASQGQSLKSLTELQETNDKKSNDNTLELLRKEKSQKQNSSELSESKVLKETKTQSGDSSGNTSTSSSSVVPSINAALPAEWQEVYDEGAKKMYYWNKQTNETTWERPMSAAAAAEASSDGGLPRGWVSKTHASTNQIFYLHSKTGLVSWTKPDENTAAATDKQTTSKKTVKRKRD